LSKNFLNEEEKSFTPSKDTAEGIAEGLDASQVAMAAAEEQV
jgi:hypothetical protein